MVNPLEATLRLLIYCIHQSYQSYGEKNEDISMLRGAFPHICNFLQLPVPDGPLVYSTDFRLNEHRAVRFNNLAFLDHDSGSSELTWLTYNYYCGLLIYSTPMELESRLGYKLTVLRKYGFNVNLPIILPTDIGLLLKNQRCLESKIIFDVHQVHSRPQHIGQAHSNIGITVNSFGQLVTSQFILRDPLGKFTFFKKINRTFFTKKLSETLFSLLFHWKNYLNTSYKY